MKDTERKTAAFNRILSIMDELRAKCPWDKKQTMQSIRHLTIEEVYELGDAILDDDQEEIKKELGDILLHIVFYSKIAEEKNWFNIADVIDEECEKLIRRHPHIYGNTQVSGEEEVKENWEQIKLSEGNKSVLGGVPVSLPALVKAMRIQDKAKASGFDWEKAEQVWEKVLEELQEFKKEVQVSDKEKIEQEFGDLLFSLVNYARFIGVNPEDALERTNKKFIGRFQYMESQVLARGQKLSELSLTDMDVYWDEANNRGL